MDGSVHNNELRDQRPAEAAPPLAVGDEARDKLDETVGAIPSRSLILIIGFGLAALALLLFGFIAQEVYAGESLQLDRSAGYFLHGYSTPTLDSLMKFVSLIGSAVVTIPLLLLSVTWLVVHRFAREAVMLVVTPTGSGLLNTVLKGSFERPRPALPWSQPISGFSFPSGHSMNSFAAYMSLAVVVWVVFGRRRGVIALLAAVILVGAVGTSRIYLGYHYFSDVIGGFAAGLLWLLAATTAIEGGRRYTARRNRTPHPTRDVSTL
ncbi:MAG: phosphatase PAP2 family protein [Chloroflexia bacterium]